MSRLFRCHIYSSAPQRVCIQTNRGAKCYAKLISFISVTNKCAPKTGFRNITAKKSLASSSLIKHPATHTPAITPQQRSAGIKPMYRRGRCRTEQARAAVPVRLVSDQSKSDARKRCRNRSITCVAGMDGRGGHEA
jgi:hypothetical protein